MSAEDLEILCKGLRSLCSCGSGALLHAGFNCSGESQIIVVGLHRERKEEVSRAAHTPSPHCLVAMI